jgi:PAS domain S-box-containing protein
MEEYVWISKAAYHKLCRQHSLISAMIENVQELALATDETGRILFANSAGRKFCGYRKNEMVA